VGCRRWRPPRWLRAGLRGSNASLHPGKAAPWFFADMGSEADRTVSRSLFSKTTSDSSLVTATRARGVFEPGNATRTRRTRSSCGVPCPTHNTNLAIKHSCKNSFEDAHAHTPNARHRKAPTKFSRVRAA